MTDDEHFYHFLKHFLFDHVFKVFNFLKNSPTFLHLWFKSEASIFTRTLGPDPTSFEVCWVQPISGPEQFVKVKG